MWKDFVTYLNLLLFFLFSTSDFAKFSTYVLFHSVTVCSCCSPPLLHLHECDHVIIWQAFFFFRIIEPLTSRCSKFRFKPLSDKIQQQRLLDVSEKENVKITSEVITE